MSIDTEQRAEYTFNNIVNNAYFFLVLILQLTISIITLNASLIGGDYWNFVIEL